MTDRREGADPDFQWTEEAREISARAELAVSAVRRGHLTGEEALIQVIQGKPDTPVYMEAVRAKMEEMPTTRERRPDGKAMNRTEHKARERERYHNDPDYRARTMARHKARRQTDAYRASERERMRRRRAAQREES